MQKVFEIAAARSALTGGVQKAFDCELPAFPVLAETLLLMDLQASEHAIDLREVSGVLLSDPGAVLQVMRLAGQDEALAECRPSRIEDCISALGLDACMEAMSRRIVHRNADSFEIVEMWAHARRIAESCRSLAQSGFPAHHPDEAYMVGLLHEIGLLPRVLGWNPAVLRTENPETAALRIAHACSLPQAVASYFSSLRSPARGNRWVELVQEAHRQEDVAIAGPAPHSHEQAHAGAWIQQA